MFEHVLGMPLDGEDLVRADGFHGFWHLVVGPGRNVQAGGDLVKRLVVRVNVGAAASELEQAAFRGYVDVVGRKVAWGILGVLEGLPRVFRQVLVDRTTKCDIDELHPRQIPMIALFAVTASLSRATSNRSRFR